MAYKINSFFAGIGGFDLAFKNKGFVTQYLCEINPFCNQILERHWVNVQKKDDINTITPKDIPLADVWCGGFPCQDISLARGASKRLGLKGARSGLFHKFSELIEVCLPQVIVIENVGGLFTSNEGRDFGVILQTLSSLNYGIAWRLLNSRYFGVPQSRTRVYLCCWHNNPTKALKVMFDKDGAAKQKNERKAFITVDGNIDTYPIVPQVAYCLAASSGRHTGTDWSRTYVVTENGVRRLSPIESERLQGFPDNWTLPLNINDSSENIDTLRYTAIGNAVSVPVVEWIASRIKNEMNDDAAMECIDSLIGNYKDFQKQEWVESDIRTIDFTDLSNKHKWARGGIVWKGKYMECNAFPAPNKIINSTLASIIEKNQNSSRYYITPNAAEGILRRVDNQRRTLFQPLRDALEKLSIQNIK